MENQKKNLRISTCSLKQWAMDFEGNQKNIIECLREVEKQKPDIVLLPELATTGYSCQDHFREKENYFLAMNIIKKIIESGLTDNMLVVIGNPIIYNNKKYNTMTYILNNEIKLIRPKITLADDGNYREARFFSSWEHGLFETFTIDLSPYKINPSKVPIGNKIIELNGIKIGTEICEELWTSNENNRVNAFNGSTKIKVHDELYKNGVNVVLNSSGSHFEMGKLEKRIKLIKKATTTTNTNSSYDKVYVYSNLIGGDGDRLYFDGASLVCKNQKLMGITERFVLSNFQICTVDVSIKINKKNNRNTPIASNSSSNSNASNAPSNKNTSSVPIASSSSSTSNVQSNKKMKIINLGTINPTSRRNNETSNITYNSKASTYNTKSIKTNEEYLKNANIEKITEQTINNTNIKLLKVTNEDIDEIINASACWMFDYLNRSGAGGFLLPLSGGADSASVCTIVYHMCVLIVENIEHEIVKKLLKDKFDITNTSTISSHELFKKIITCVYLPNEGKSSSETKLRSMNICKLFSGESELGPSNKISNIKQLINWKEVPITPMYQGALEILLSQFPHDLLKNYKIIKEKRLTIVSPKQQLKELLSNYRNKKNTLSHNSPLKKYWSISLADENVQARLRMVITYLLAQIFAKKSFLLTLACSNSDEILVGYYTKYDASSGDINPIGSLPKIYVNKILEYYGHKMLKTSINKHRNITRVNNKSGNKTRVNALLKTLYAQPTAELQNLKKGKIAQSNEADIGLTYEQIEVIGNLRAQGMGMIEVYENVKQNPLFKKNGNANYTREKVEKFYHRYSINRNKATIVTPSVHLLPNPDDNRFDLRPFLYPPREIQKEIIKNNSTGTNKKTNIKLNSVKNFINKNLSKV